MARVETVTLPAHGRARAADSWVVAALVPALSDADFVPALAWGAAVLAGSLLAGARPLRWVAVAWAAAAAVPGASLAGIAAAGSMTPVALAQAGMAVTGTLAAAALPVPLRTAPVLLLLAAGALSLVARRG